MELLEKQRNIDEQLRYLTTKETGEKDELEYYSTGINKVSDIDFIRQVQRISVEHISAGELSVYWY